MDDDPSAGFYLSPPVDYVVPGWPGLYLPWEDPQYLYYPSSIWRYTVYWSLLLTGVSFGLCGGWAFLIFARRSKRHLRFAIWLPVAYIVIGGLISFVSGTVIGFALVATYNAVYIRMSTWVPFLWSAAQTLVVVIGSYSTVTFLL